MASFSVGEALGAPFRVMGRRPMLVLAWGLAYMVIVFVPMLVLGSMMIPGIMAIAQAGDNADPAAAMSLMGPILLFYPVLFLVSIAAQAVLMGAAYRSILEPEESRFAYLRFSGQELWLALVSVVMFFLLGIAAGAFFVPIAIIGGVMAAGADSAGGGAAAAGLMVFPFMMVGFCLFVWLALRFSMALPMTFADRTFRLFESWAVTRGHTLKLLGMFVLLVLIIIAVEIVMYAVGFGAIFAVFGGNFAAIESGNLAALGGSLVAAGVIFLFLMIAFTGIVSLISYAPLADAYRQLRGASSPEAAAFA